MFNAILVGFGVLTLAFADWRDALFLFILIANSGIGIAQEVRAKRSLDRLAALVAPSATVVSEGSPRELRVEDVVPGDLVELRPGDQVVADGQVEEASGLQLDESILTGESRPVTRGPGEDIRSGSFAVEGSAAYTVTAVGPDSYAERLAGEAREFRHPRSPGRDPTYETWTMLCFVAAATSRIRIATRVLGVPYRNPAMVAKMAESLDRLSGGRLILGLGAGSADDEHWAFGLGVRTPKEKTDGLEEAVTIIRGLWSEPAFTFTGRSYRTEAADIEPKPERRIPIWLGTFAPRALAVTGRLADGWIPSLAYAPPGEIVAMRERLLEAARKAGRDPGDITCAYNVEVRIDEHAAPEPHVVVGAPGAVIETLTRFVQLGFSALNFMVGGPDADEQAERLAIDVLPALRAR